MDWATAIIGSIAILLCIVPFVMSYYNGVQKKNKMLQTLTEGAHKHNCKISQHELCGDFVLGIDENRNFVFFLKQKKKETAFQFVDLAEIQTCQINKKTRDMKNASSSLFAVQKLELCFLPKDKNKPETRFELYDGDINMQMNGELQFVDKWTKYLNERLKTKAKLAV